MRLTKLVLGPIYELVYNLELEDDGSSGYIYLLD